MFLTSEWNEIPDFFNTNANRTIINPEELEFVGSFGL